MVLPQRDAVSGWLKESYLAEEVWVLEGRTAMEAVGGLVGYIVMVERLGGCIVVEEVGVLEVCIVTEAVVERIGE